MSNNKEQFKQIRVKVKWTLEPLADDTAACTEKTSKIICQEVDRNILQTMFAIQEEVFRSTQNKWVTTTPSLAQACTKTVEEEYQKRLESRTQKNSQEC